MTTEEQREEEEDSSATAESEEIERLFISLPDPAAREELARLFQPLAEYLARRFFGRGEPLEDLVQVANLGLLKAIDRFDLSRGVKFSTYATATVVGELKRHFRDKGWALRVPRRLQESGMKVGRTVTEMYQDLGRAPTVAEIAERTGLSEDEVLEAMETAHAYTTASLDAPTDEEGATSLDRLGEEEQAFELLEGWTMVAPAIRELPARERNILYLRFFRGLTQTQIADELGISQMHVSRLLSRTLRDLRRKIGEPDEA
ncbi:MAG TPA: SigB/SigF/SigG family RNA polymerase sigma factor [Actinomycetota bacterium]|nr:SigB/SigF/SigG family RNA polymerase sigma factor [Actinomycetota bacterium]